MFKLKKNYNGWFCLLITGLPHTQGTQGISGNFKVKENLMETQGDSGKLKEFRFSFKTQGSFDFF